jgi:NAD(P)-dependent dehydrogenase (short-subunit alcohol dehydrogenase family)
VSPAQFQARLEQSTLIKRLPTLDEVAETAAFVASDRDGAMTATVVTSTQAASPSEQPE